MTDDQAIRNEELAAQFVRVSTHIAVLRSCARDVLSRCQCGGTGKTRRQRGFFTVEVECTKCLPIREALATGEII